MGLPERDRLLCQQAWKRCRGPLEKRGWVKPAETEEGELKKQHQAPVTLVPAETEEDKLKKQHQALVAPTTAETEEDELKKQHQAPVAPTPAETEENELKKQHQDPVAPTPAETEENELKKQHQDPVAPTPAETEEDELKKQHQAPVAPTPLQSTIPAVLKKLERAYEAPAHITANDHPDDWEPSNRDSGGSWDPTSVTSHHAVSLAHPEPSAPPNTGAFNSAPTSRLSTGSSASGLDPPTTAPEGAAYHGRGSSFHSHDKRASVIDAFPLERTVILEQLSEDNNDDENDNGTNPYPMSAYVKTKMTDGNYNRAARRNAIDHGQGTGTRIWLEVSGSGGAAEGPEGPVDDSGSASPPPPEAVPKAKEIFPLLSVPSQAVSTSSLSPSPEPRAREVASVVNGNGAT